MPDESRDAVLRLEADLTQADLGRGLSAEVADPAWFLGCQWRLGEHLGEDAASPIQVIYRATTTPITLTGGGLPPVEAVVEAGHDDWWTPGRRVSAGRMVAAAAAAAGRPLHLGPDLLLASLPTPYDILDGTGPDGRALWTARDQFGLDPAWFGPDRPPDPTPDRWDPAELTHHADLGAGPVTLRLRGHDGGEPIDWFSVNATGPIPPPVTSPAPVTVLTSRARWPGAPNPRWWQLEDPATDPGGYPPDRSHFPSLLLLEALSSHSGDWFTFPIATPTGHILTLHEVTVRDAFGDTWTLTPPVDGWTLFAVTGLAPRSLTLLPTSQTPLAGPATDEIDIGIDEDANLLWAVERRINSREVPTDLRPPATPGERIDAAAAPAYAYRPSGGVPAHWHPYLIEVISGRRRFVQGRLADLTSPTPELAPPPGTDLLIDPASGGTHPVHQLDPSVIPTDGLRLERRWILARRTNGSPILWTQRRRVPLGVPPALRLHTDALAAGMG